ncbi:MAG TPA: VWA domain-containing protein [Pyrinomonadaceae bacterium]|nr:VWA domain-containing protein [Pyrinomonadaceae bacterium]
MSEREGAPKYEPRLGDGDEEGGEPLRRALRERLRSVRSPAERRNIAGLAREAAKLPADSARAALEVGAATAAVSLRAAVEFLRAVPAAGGLLDAAELRAWGEMGRRLTMADVETGVAFFAGGPDPLAELPRAARLPLVRVCVRQMSLSTSVALDSLRRAPELARTVGDEELLRRACEVADEVARRSAKHSADFLNATPAAFAALRAIDGDGIEASTSREALEASTSREGIGTGAGREGVEASAGVTDAGLRLAEAFAHRAGGIAADVWAELPTALAGLDAERALALMAQAEGFLDRGGAAALHVLTSGGETMRLLPEVFDDWSRLLRAVAQHSNAALVAAARTGPPFFRATAATRAPREQVAATARRVLAVAREVAAADAEAAILCLRSAPRALRTTTIEQFERWAAGGLADQSPTPRARRSYYALETRRSNEQLQGGPEESGLALETVSQTLRLYVEGLTGRAVEVAPLSAVPDEQRIGDGRTIHLPAEVSEFGEPESDFRLYKVLAAHAAGQIEFGTHERETPRLGAAYAALADLYAPENQDARDAFSLDGYINDPAKGERALPPEEEERLRRVRRSLPEGADYRAVLALFPQRGLAARIFGTLENGRVDRRLRHAYRGLARDLDLVRERLRRNRPRIAGLPVTLVPFELLFQITLCGGALEDARAAYGQITSELESIVVDYLTEPGASVADTLMATGRVYSLFQSVVPEISERQREEGQEAGEDEQQQEGAQSDLELEKDEGRDPDRRREEGRRRQDARELFNAWAAAESLDQAGEETLSGAERWFAAEAPEQELGPGEEAFEYDEWDRDLSDTRLGWCRVVEKKTKRGERSFVELTRSRYRGVISSIRHQFQLMRPENFKRIPNELDGDDYDLNALIDFVVDRRVDGRQSERLYTRRLRRERDVAVSFLLDQSSSTARTIGRNPLQPYTHPGRRIIEVEKEGLVLMSEALEAVGDPYSIYGFTSEGRRNVKFYVVKEFGEPYDEEIERRIGGITYHNNTRLGAAIRHAAAKLRAQEARTRLLIILSDGRPYDHDYGDARYAREDTREALRQARLDGITPFCVTIDRDSEAELRDLYGEVGYTIIDDVLGLPERIPAIYRRLTT